MLLIHASVHGVEGRVWSGIAVAEGGNGYPRCDVIGVRPAELGDQPKQLWIP